MFSLFKFHYERTWHEISIVSEVKKNRPKKYASGHYPDYCCC